MQIHPIIAYAIPVALKDELAGIPAKKAAHVRKLLLHRLAEMQYGLPAIRQGERRLQIQIYEEIICYGFVVHLSFSVLLREAARLLLGFPAPDAELLRILQHSAVRIDRLGHVRITTDLGA